MPDHPARLPHDERRWLAAAATFTLLFFNLPYLIGALRSTPQQPFTGVLVSVADTYSYYAKIRMGTRGHLLFQNAYALEPHPETVLYTVYQAAGGLLARIIPDQPITLGQIAAAYHLVRIAASLLLLIRFYQVTALFLAESRWRRLAWIILVYGGGFGWLAMTVTRSPLVLGGPYDIFLNEAANPLAMIGNCHMVLARAALLSGLLELVRAVEGGQWSHTLAAGAWWLLAALALPFTILTAGAVVAGWAALTLLSERRGPARLILHGLLAGLAGGLVVLIPYLTVFNHPVYAAWQQQDLRVIGGPLHLLVGYGMQLVLALLALWWVARSEHDTPRRPLLLAWAIVPLLLTQLPLWLRQRLIETWFIPLAILAVCAFRHLFWHRPPLIRRLAGALWLALTLPSGLFLMLGGLAVSWLGLAPAYLPTGTASGYGWLLHSAPQGAVVLAGGRTGTALPAAAPVQPVWGHPFETPHLPEKEQAVRLFFDRAAPRQDRLAVLSRYGVDYVFYGPEERLLACPDSPCDAAELSTGDLPLQMVYQSEDIIIYQVIDPR